MKCRNCGADIPEHQVLCPKCGQEVQMVPDYNPLDDVITTQVRDALGRTMSLEKQGLTGQDILEEPVESRTRASAGRNRYDSQDMRSRSTGRQRKEGSLQNTNARRQAEKRRQAERKRQLAKKKRRRMILILCAFLAAGIAAGMFFYQNSYGTIVKKGYQALVTGSPQDAEALFKKAVKKDRRRPDAYTALAQLYADEGDLKKAESLFTEALESQPSNADLYRAVFKFYMDTEQEQKISVLLDDCKDKKVLAELGEYVSKAPQFSLDPKVTYQDVQALEITSDGKAVYYTTDGSDPMTSGIKYTEPVVLNEEATEVRAVSMNKKGIPSLEIKKTFHIEFPEIEAPNVTPSTGQYDTWQTITVEEKEGCEIRYTTDGTMPDKTSVLYTGPIEMPSGSCIFTFVYIDGAGRVSQSTMRSYNLVVE